MTSAPARNRWLDAAVVGVAAVAVLTIAPFGASAAEIAVLVGALLVFVVTWLIAGPRALAYVRGWWQAVIVVLVLSCAVGALVSPAFATFQVVAFPVAWLVSPGLRPAIVANLGVGLAIGVGYAVGTSVVEALAVEGVSLAFSLAMGMWITRISEESEGRRALIDELTAAQQQLAVLHRDAGAVAERERLARDLHDTLTQSVAGIVMLAERARSRHPGDASLGVLEDAARQALAEARALVTDGANVPLERGLAGALSTLAERFRRETGLEVDVEVTAEVPRGLEVVLLRCAQEALANVRKHASASAVRLAVAAEEDSAVLTVTDDGGGPGDGEGFGIAGMRDRLALVDGDVELTPGPAGGARLTVRVPLTAAVTR